RVTVLFDTMGYKTVKLDAVKPTGDTS
ncbi:MAG: hypothetical protein QOJ03_2865, partial [Frankiaceae bacterium]|nr:hypothetical protein [Frankiaceae bacterium]